MGIGKPVVQGMFGQRLPILNNGFRMEGQTWGLDHAPETDLWGVQSVILLRGTDALAVAADAWGNAINLINQYDFHEYNRDFTQLISAQSNGRGLHVAGKYIRGRSNIAQKNKHPYGKGQYALYSARITGNYSTPSQTLKNTGTKEASLSYGNLWNSKRGYWGIPAISNREIHVKAYVFQGGIFAESHIGNVNDLLAAMARKNPQYDAPFTYNIDKPQQQAVQIQATTTATSFWANTMFTTNSRYNQISD
jgi:iron complex outermembrane receptor protein